MAIIEFQMSTAAFLRAQRNALLQRQICLPGPFAFDAVNGVGPINIVLDRLDFGANALVHNVRRISTCWREITKAFLGRSISK